MISELLLLQKIHGHVALLGAALCLHPPLALRRAKRTTWAVRLSGWLASAFVIATNALGWWIYPAYREEVKLDLYRWAKPWGVLFEVKEHFGWISVGLALAGCALMWASARPGGKAFVGSIRAVYLAMALLVIASGVMGVLISSVNGFAYGLQVPR